MYHHIWQSTAVARVCNASIHSIYIIYQVCYILYFILNSMYYILYTIHIINDRLFFAGDLSNDVAVPVMMLLGHDDDSMTAEGGSARWWRPRFDYLGCKIGSGLGPREGPVGC